MRRRPKTLVDIAPGGRYRSVNPRVGLPVKRATLTFLLFLLGTLVCALAVPPTDLPETAFNEMDTPVNQAPPVVPTLKLVRPAAEFAMIAPELRGEGSNADPHGHELVLEPAPSYRSPHSVQDLLCVLLV